MKIYQKKLNGHQTTNKYKYIYVLAIMSGLLFLLFGVSNYSFADLYGNLFNYLEKQYNREKEELYKYDFDKDDSFQKIILKDKGMNDKLYIPKDLIYLKDKYIFNASYHKLRKDAAFHLGLLARSFYENFETTMSVRSAYRGYHTQFDMWTVGCRSFVAKPGTSEHQLGLAVDIFYVSNNNLKIKAGFGKYFKWLQENAHKFGYHNTYQKGVKIDDYKKEPRHRRFVGVKLATELYEKKMTLTEYYRSRVKDMKKRGYEIKSESKNK